MFGTETVAFTLALIMIAAAALAIEPNGLLGGLAKAKDFEARRSSSENPVDRDNNNHDYKLIEPGETLTIADLEGPGRIVHLWFTMGAKEPQVGKKAVLRCYWDGEKDPSVESPINDFFCSGHAMDAEVNSLPIRVTGDGNARNCWFPMPFRKSAKVTMTNDGKERLVLYYYVDWQKLPSLPEDELYFHAKYRQEYPCIPGRDYLFLEAEGRGHYVGCNLSVRLHEKLWWGEGDDRFYIDGDTEPTIAGTGSEDYFCDAYGLRQREGLFYGVPILEDNEAPYARTTAYRFHIPDPIPFKRSLKFTIEHKAWVVLPSGKWDGFSERWDDYSSVAYWYQTEPHKEFFKLPPVEDRFYKDDTVVIEAEALLDAATSEGAKPERQDGHWSGGAQILFAPDGPDASLTLEVPIEKTGVYSLGIDLTKADDYGKYRILFDGKEIATTNLYSDDLSSTMVTTEFQEIKQGKHTLTFECTGKSNASRSYFLGIDKIELRPELPRPQREG